ncbi:nucleotidyltransferase domain-containing protein [Candidatus Pacearchaeota archaeon]|nr:nucleotidyltransferase domain-containing protein [Candidatus Pacearchaeota archaeon]
MIRKLKASLLYAVKNTPELRSIFGKRELEIIQKQCLGIRLTPSEQMRLSRDIKKKFRAIRVLADFDESALKKGSHIRLKINEVKDEILNSRYLHRIKKIVLFGSTAVNQRTIRSDIDLAVEFDKISLKDAAEFRIKFNYDESIDVQVYNILPDKIKREIDKHGRIIWKREI